MTDEELTNYKSQLETDISNIKSQIRELYNSAQIDYSNGEYVRSLDTLDKVDELISQYNEKQDTYNKVLSEIDKRAKAKVVQQPVVQPKEEVKVTGTYKTYKVIKGDFLSRIATKLFNGGYWWWPKIFVLNKDKISDPDLIDEGQELKIPTSLPE
jgi:LysM repeat protein